MNDQVTPITGSADPFFWLREQFAASHGARWRAAVDRLDKRRERTILQLLQRIESRIRRGETAEDIGRAVAEVCGPLARFVTGFRLGDPRGASARILFVDCANPAVAFELARLAPTLRSRLAHAGIQDVRFR